MKSAERSSSEWFDTPPGRLLSQFDAPLLRPSRRDVRQQTKEDRPFSNLSLELVPQAFFVPVRLHAFAALVFRNFCFPSFFKRAHSGFWNRSSDSIT